MTTVWATITGITLSQVLTWSYILLVLIFMHMVWRISSREDTKFDWIDLISNPDGTASLTRILQLVAGITATWIVIKLTASAHISVDFFAAYLAAMGISEGFNKWVQAKYKSDNDTEEHVEEHIENKKEVK